MLENQTERMNSNQDMMTDEDMRILKWLNV